MDDDDEDSPSGEGIAADELPKANGINHSTL